MKKKLTTAALTLCMISLGSLYAYAYSGHGNNGGHHTTVESEHGEQHATSEHQEQHPTNDHKEQHATNGHSEQNNHGMMTWHLNLTEEQQEQIKAIHEDEMLANEELREKMHGYKTEIRDLSAEENFDEYAVRTLAEEKAAIQVELTVSKARMKSEIQALLSTEQQESMGKDHSAGHNNTGTHHRTFAQ